MFADAFCVRVTHINTQVVVLNFIFLPKLNNNIETKHSSKYNLYNNLEVINLGQIIILCKLFLIK